MNFFTWRESLFVIIFTNHGTVLPSLSLLPRAIEISSQARIGVYDCLYVALAEREGCEFVTADNKRSDSGRWGYSWAADPARLL